MDFTRCVLQLIYAFFHFLKYRSSSEIQSSIRNKSIVWLNWSLNNWNLALTHFFPIFLFYNPEKFGKTLFICCFYGMYHRGIGRKWVKGLIWKVHMNGKELYKWVHTWLKTTKFTNLQFFKKINNVFLLVWL